MIVLESTDRGGIPENARMECCLVSTTLKNLQPQTFWKIWGNYLKIKDLIDQEPSPLIFVNEHRTCMIFFFLIFTL